MQKSESQSMNQAIVFLLRALLFSLSAAAVADDSPAAPIGLETRDGFQTISNVELIDAIIAAAPVRRDNRAIEPAARSLTDDDWAGDREAGVAYAVSNNLSLGLDYEHEGIEDLTAAHIEMGSAGVDYTSHKVLVRANLTFDLAR